MRVEVNGVRLFFDVEGARLVPDGTTIREHPSLVLLHGGPAMDGSYWRPWFSELSGVAQIIYLDQRGTGRSDHGPKEGWKHSQWADDVRAFCDALDIRHPIVCGSSFGASVAMAYAARHPEHPSKLIILSGAARENVARKRAVFKRLGGTYAAYVAERFWRDPTVESGAEYMRVCIPLYFRTAQDPQRDLRVKGNLDLTWHYLRDEGGCISDDLLPGLAAVRCPTLLIGGEDDPVTTIEDMADIAAAISPELVRFERIPNCGHGPFFDRPDETLAFIREFIVS